MLGRCALRSLGRAAGSSQPRRLHAMPPESGEPQPSSESTPSASASATSPNLRLAVLLGILTLAVLVATSGSAGKLLIEVGPY